jgi:Ca2+-binding EF-hand superfamily protein
MLERYDTDRSGNLNAEELTQLLAHYDNGIKSDWDEYHTGLVLKNIGSVTPTAEEVDLLLKAAAKHKKSSVDASELSFVLDLWHSYVMNRTEIETVFEKFDPRHSQKLEFHQLKGYLTTLNEGHAPKVMNVLENVINTIFPPS